MNTQKLKVLQVINRSGVSKKTGNAWSIFSAQCVLEQEVDGKQELMVGTINLPEALQKTEPGDYLANFAFFQSMEGKLEPRITALQPWGRPAAKPRTDAVAA